MVRQILIQADDGAVPDSRFYKSYRHVHPLVSAEITIYQKKVKNKSDEALEDKQGSSTYTSRKALKWSVPYSVAKVFPPRCFVDFVINKCEDEFDLNAAIMF